ncbi:MAG TPA: VWA domain-containing protein [Vicinamibacterales bacterium]|nr:VWA domain-containing protein [Vicinamibacterales bacterium]
MRRIAATLLAIVLALTASAAAQKQTIKVATDSVAVYVTVTDAEKRLVPDLVLEDFEILDNAKPVTINVFENKPVPISTVVMLDTSGSITASLGFVKEGAEQFLLRLLPDDKAQVGEFSDKIKFHPGNFIDDRDRLIYLLKNELDFGYPTRLWDAVDQSIVQLLTIDGRKVVVVFTDGDDTASKLGVGKVMDHAREKDVMVYAVGLETEYFNGQSRVRSSPDRSLKKLAEDTGGGFFLLKKTADLGETFTRVAQELHSQYVLGFSPETSDGKIHKLEVRVKKAGMNARARKTYMAALAGTK